MKTLLDQQTEQRISQLTDTELLRMIAAKPDEYRPEALAFARAEIQRRGLTDPNEGLPNGLNETQYSEKERTLAEKTEQRISHLPDAELLRMMTRAKLYRPEVLACARAEIERRGIPETNEESSRNLGKGHTEEERLLRAQTELHISELADIDLLKMVLKSKPDEYRAEALAFARAEIQRRGITEVNEESLRRMEEKEYVDPLEGIAGWLRIPHIGLTLGPLFSGVLLFINVKTLQAIAPELLTDPRLWLSIALDLFLIVGSVVVALLFLRRRRATIRAVVGLLSGSVIVGFFQVMLHSSLFGDFDGELICRPAMVAAVWIPYFLTSRRVQKTFVY